MNNLKNRIEELDRKNRENNKIIIETDIFSGEDYSITKTKNSFLKIYLELNVDINKRRKIGHKQCLLQLVTEEDKINIMKNQSKVKTYETKSRRQK